VKPWLCVVQVEPQDPFPESILHNSGKSGNEAKDRIAARWDARNKGCPTTRRWTRTNLGCEAMRQKRSELSSGCAGASQEIILCYRKIQLVRDDLEAGSRICRHRRRMTDGGGRIDRDVARGLG
jgi:hypothetical protein